MPAPKRELIEGGLPEIDGPVYLQALKITRRAELLEGEGHHLARSCKVLAEMAVREDGTPVYTADDWDQFAGNDLERFNQILDQSYVMSKLNSKLGGEKKESTPS